MRAAVRFSMRNPDLTDEKQRTPAEDLTSPAKKKEGVGLHFPEDEGEEEDEQEGEEREIDSDGLTPRGRRFAANWRGRLDASHERGWRASGDSASSTHVHVCMSMSLPTRPCPCRMCIAAYQIPCA